ncbi:MAG: hydantoinase B/oxoprolinase family protein, partial [Dehalococcoidia bacterium]
RIVGPYGLAGGGAALPGRNTFLRPDGSEEPLGGHAALQVKAGDRIRIETPGGGGWGDEIA